MLVLLSSDRYHTQINNKYVMQALYFFDQL